MRKLYLSILALSLFAGACKPESEVAASYSEDYRFFLKGQVNGLPFEYNAGENDYYMETDYYIEDSVVVMEGKLYQESNPGKNCMTIKVRGAVGAAYSTPFVLENNLAAQAYAFRDATGNRAQTGKYLISFFGDSSLSNFNYTWHFPDGDSVRYDPNPQKVVDIDKYQSYPVRLEASHPSGCRSEVTHYVNLEHDCDATFRMLLPGGTIVKTEVIARIGSVDRVEWFLDTNRVSPNFQGEIDLALFPAATTLKCVVYFEDGCVKTIERALTSNLLNQCITDFWYTKQKPTTYDPLQHSTVEIDYYDDNGKKFSSYYTNVDGDFRIISTSPYRENGKGQETVRFFLETDVILKNTDGSTVELKNAFGSFAVAHP